MRIQYLSVSYYKIKSKAADRKTGGDLIDNGNRNAPLINGAFHVYYKILKPCCDADLQAEVIQSFIISILFAIG